MPRPAAPDAPLVLFRLHPARHVHFADVRGEFTHWRHILPLQDMGDGWLEGRARVPVGVYGYKYCLAGGEWLLDPANPRTRTCDGVRNSLLVVGGAAEPVMHAPAPPWVHLAEDGRLCLRAGLRRSAGQALTVRWDEGSGEVQTPLFPVAEEDEHLLFEAHLPVSARTLEYVFVLPDGQCVGTAGGAAQRLRLSPASLRRERPAWWRDAVLYTIFVDRFRRGGTGGLWGAAPGERAAAGGDLDGIVEALPYLADLGVTALHLTPIAVSHSAHRYDAVDPRAVDPALGGEAALARLFAAAEARGIRTLLDVTVTHVHRDFAPFRNVRARGKASPYWSWFRPLGFPFREGPEPGYEHYQKGQWQEPLLNTDHPEVREFLMGTFEHWTQLGAAGFRVDAAADIPLDLVQRIRDAVHAVRPDAVVYGEIIPDNLARWTTGALDAATDFVTQQALYDWLCRRSVDAARVGVVHARRRFARPGPGCTSIGFTATHDQPRLLTLTGDLRAARLGHLWVLTRPEVPALYYGDEVGLRSAEAGARDFEDAWPDRMPMCWEPASWDQETLAFLRAAIALRRGSAALRVGDDVALSRPDAPDVLAFRRTHGEEVVEIYLHRGDAWASFPLPDDAPSGARVLLTLGEVEITQPPGSGPSEDAPDSRHVRLGPYAGLVLSRELEPDLRATWEQIREHNREVARDAWRTGQLETVSLPCHLYVTVTERCNLRCRHCITHAPELTQDGRARHISPWVIDALGDAFAAADYIGFSHGGESLTSPAFFDVLRAIGAARRAPCDIHLLTNGMLLDGEMARRLIDLGVTSLAFSLDGASPETNDRIRDGGRFERVVANLREVVALRARAGADLRVGISSVIGLSNLHELEALGRLAVDLGVDWLKVEEVYRATPFACHEYLPPDDPRLAAPLRALSAFALRHKLVLVDHFSPPGGCPCHAPSRAFREADDFANRARFRPCRMAWEQACIDPDGTVRPVDYDHPPLGNLGTTPFPDLWNGEVARGLRAYALDAWRGAPCLERGR